MKAAIYARFSTEMQNDASIEDQQRECRRVAVSNGFDIVSCFEDRGISGGTTSRPGYQALLDAARGGQFEVIVVEAIDRLWRNRAEFGVRSTELEDLNVNLVTCVGDDTRREGWGLVLGIKSAIAEHARKEISYRTRRGLQGKAIAGESTGGRTYGYLNGKVDPHEASVIQTIFKLSTERWSRIQIAGYLNGQHEPGPRGGIWRASTIGSILTNPKYTGQYAWGAKICKGSATDSKRRIRTVRADGPLVERVDEGLRIVSDEVFYNTRRRMVA